MTLEHDLLQLARDAMRALMNGRDFSTGQTGYYLNIIRRIEDELSKPKPEQESGKCGCGANLYIDEDGKPCSKVFAQPEQEPVCDKDPSLRQALAQPEHMTPISPDQYERLCFTCGACVGKPWVGLSDKEIKGILDCGSDGLIDIKKAEQTLKDKNT